MERKRVDSKLLLFTLVLVLITLLLLNWLLGGNNTDEIWNYKEITSASDLVDYGEEIEDREVYYILESIVQQYLNSYVNTYNEDMKADKLSYTQYYEYLTKNYREYLSKAEYKKLAETFLIKFKVYAESEYEAMEYMDIEQVVKEIYVFENNVYLCRLKGMYTGNVGYIAIALDTSKNAFNIVYIE